MNKWLWIILGIYVSIIIYGFLIEGKTSGFFALIMYSLMFSILLFTHKVIAEEKGVKR